MDCIDAGTGVWAWKAGLAYTGNTEILRSMLKLYVTNWAGAGGFVPFHLTSVVAAQSLPTSFQVL